MVVVVVVVTTVADGVTVPHRKISRQIFLKTGYDVQRL